MQVAIYRDELKCIYYVTSTFSFLALAWQETHAHASLGVLKQFGFKQGCAKLRCISQLNGVDLILRLCETQPAVLHAFALEPES